MIRRMQTLFDGYDSRQVPRRHVGQPWDEMFPAAGQGTGVREPYRELITALERLDDEELRARTEALATSYMAQGVTFDFAGEERPFPLDVVPRVVSADDWSYVESGVALVLASNKSQAADQAMFRHVGVEPSACRVVALKSSVHFRADFAPIAQEVLVVQAPGPALADPADYPWQRLRPGMRLGPLGPAFMPGRLQDSPAGSGSAAA